MIRGIERSFMHTKNTCQITPVLQTWSIVKHLSVSFGSSDTISILNVLKQVSCFVCVCPTCPGMTCIGASEAAAICSKFALDALDMQEKGTASQRCFLTSWHVMTAFWIFCLSKGTSTHPWSNSPLICILWTVNMSRRLKCNATSSIARTFHGFPRCLLILSPAGIICICEGALALGADAAGVSKQLNFASIDEESSLLTSKSMVKVRTGGACLATRVWSSLLLSCSSLSSVMDCPTTAMKALWRFAWIAWFPWCNVLQTFASVVDPLRFPVRSGWCKKYS